MQLSVVIYSHTQPTIKIPVGNNTIEKANSIYYPKL